ncbi:hypothetical protein TeGR_g6497 [Tetraparma gracilis]|uniref:C2H2-type domain-containing protein n=1 Tax=Tetraparma gracilis TaxID=2962635 RepID=A0ABQ6MUD3_9STRA|nr:hypothetical protein TeGR_g6497 [Tetraparma gracilis]
MSYRTAPPPYVPPTSLLAILVARRNNPPPPPPQESPRAGKPRSPRASVPASQRSAPRPKQSPPARLPAASLPKAAPSPPPPKPTPVTPPLPHPPSSLMEQRRKTSDPNAPLPAKRGRVPKVFSDLAPAPKKPRKPKAAGLAGLGGLGGEEGLLAVPIRVPIRVEDEDVEGGGVEGTAAGGGAGESGASVSPAGSAGSASVVSGEEGGATIMSAVVGGKAGEKWHHCPECDYKAKRPRELKQHRMYKHDVDVIWHTCTFEGCAHKAKCKKDIKVHMAHVHNLNPILLKCSMPNCTFTTKHRSSMKNHLKNHQIEGGESDWLHCRHPDCFYKTKSEDNMKKHEAKSHSPIECQCLGKGLLGRWGICTYDCLESEETGSVPWCGLPTIARADTWLAAKKKSWRLRRGRDEVGRKPGEENFGDAALCRTFELNGNDVCFLPDGSFFQYEPDEGVPRREGGGAGGGGGTPAPDDN